MKRRSSAVRPAPPTDFTDPRLKAPVSARPVPMQPAQSPRPAQATPKPTRDQAAKSPKPATDAAVKAKGARGLLGELQQQAGLAVGMWVGQRVHAGWLMTDE